MSTNGDTDVEEADYELVEDGSSDLEGLSEQVRIAREFPRSIKESVDRAVTLATRDEETAESCWYSYPTGGDMIEGPTIGLAEIIGQSWGNIMVQGEIVRIGREEVVGLGQAVDLERNFWASREVNEDIVDSKGQRYPGHLIKSTANAAVSKAVRNAIFSVVPRTYVDEVLEQAKKAVLSGKTMEELRENAIAFFEERGASESQVLDLVDASGREDIDREALINLRGMANLIKDGQATVSELLEDSGGESETARSINEMDVPEDDESSQTDEDDAEADEPDGDTEAPDEEEPSASAPDLFEEQAREIVDQNAGPAREEIGLADDPTLLYRALSIEQTGKQRKTVIQAIEERLSEIVSGEATCPTGKVPFEYEEDAERALERAKEARDRGNEARQETRYYECGECGHYHLTSQGSDEDDSPENPRTPSDEDREIPGRDDPDEDPETVDMNTVLEAVGVYIDKSDVISIVDIRRTMEAHDMKDSALLRLTDTLHAVVEGDVEYQTEDGVIQLKDT